MTVIVGGPRAKPPKPWEYKFVKSKSQLVKKVLLLTEPVEKVDELRHVFSICCPFDKRIELDEVMAKVYDGGEKDSLSIGVGFNVYGGLQVFDGGC